jgi:hypothetical protein
MEKLAGAEIEIHTEHISAALTVFSDPNKGFQPLSSLIRFLLASEPTDFSRENFIANEFYSSIPARYGQGIDEADLQDLSDIFLTLRDFFSPETACFSTDYGKKYADELMTMKKDFYSKISAEMREKTADFWFSDVTLILTYQKKGNFSLQIDPDFYQKIFPNVRICLSVYE